VQTWPDKSMRSKTLSGSLRKFQNRDEDALQQLLEKVFPIFNDNELWFWKYRRNPDFDNSLVVIAEKDGQLVGSNYWVLRNLKLSSSLQVKAALGADVAVDPNFRGEGIGKELLRFPRTSGFFKEKGILLSYMFSSYGLTKRFQGPTAGYTKAPAGTTVFRKIFDCEELKARFQEIDGVIRSNESMMKQLKKLDICIFFNLTGAPEFSVNIRQGKVYLEEGKAVDSDVIVEGSLPLSSAIIGAVSLGDLVKLWFMGKIKIRRGIFHIFKLRKAFALFRSAIGKEF
jgi:predicted N-acetyltransferase YhbS